MATAAVPCAPCSGTLRPCVNLLPQQLSPVCIKNVRMLSRRESRRCITTSASKKSEQVTAERAASASVKAEKKSLIQRVEDPLAARDYRPPQEGDEPDFFEGSSWDAVGFVLQYLWAFGIGIAILACIYAVRTYNSGASDFTQTPAFQSAQEAARPAERPSTTTETDDAPPL